MNKEELYDKCENMEQLYDKYYSPLQTNWNELKKWLQGYIQTYDNRMSLPFGDVIRLSKEKMLLNNVLNKMAEMERGEE